VSGTLTSIDIENLRREEQVFDMLKTFDEMAPGELLRRLPRLSMDRFRRLQDEVRNMDPSGAQRFLTEAGIRFVVGDAGRTDFQSRQFDQIISNYTFEHIPRATLEEILVEFRRVLSPAGLMTHLIDMSDHYSHFDRSITPYNFLRYPRWRWRWFNNSLQYQNRLRASDYRALHIAAGFEIVEERLGTSRMGELDAVPLAPEFAGYSRTDLAATHAWLVTRVS
jgi:SAM-dependent methyltransferase